MPAVSAFGINPLERSISNSRQFIVYCDDVSLRHKVAAFAEEVKSDALKLIGRSGSWKIPIVITLEKGQGLDPMKSPVSLVMQATPQGPKIQMDVKIGDDPGTVFLQRHIVRAVYLEYSYRDRKIRGGEEIVLPAWWLVAGAIETFRRRDLGVDTDLFARLVETNRMPEIDTFLSLHPDSAGEAAQLMDGAYGMALLQLLTEQPNGRHCLANFVRDWPDQANNPVGALTRAFPGLGEGSAGLQKWWTLNIARLSAADRYRGLSIEETDRRLNALLDVELTVGPEGEKKSFNVAEFTTFLGNKEAKKALAARHGEVVALSAQANSLFRPVVRGYEEVFARLMRGKTRGVRDQILKTEIYRETVLHRMNDIADYLNWYEATQLGVRTNAFDSYLRAARAIEADHRKQPIEEEIQKYLDALEAQL
ncbi:MAG: hypothetical protein ABI680_12455 [Chthoniobacteraceae bacterium]